MNESNLIGLSIGVYMVSRVLYLLNTAFKKKGMGLAGDLIALAGLVLQSLAIVVRWEESEGLLKRRLPPADLLDDFSYRIIAVGFPMMTLGIITGAAWANSAWGTYWSWDPKETWSLVVWLIYAAYLHARIARGWQGKRAAWLSILGFAATMFCYLGVNLFLSGLHSYATG